MIKKYRAYESKTDHWHYFKIIATETGWEISYANHNMGDEFNTSVENNFNMAYSNLCRIVEQNKYEKLTDITKER